MMLHFQNLSRFGGGGRGSSKVAFYRFEGAAPHAVALFLPGNFFNTEGGSVYGACRKKECVLYLIGLLTNIHLSITCSMLLWFDTSSS